MDRDDGPRMFDRDLDPPSRQAVLLPEHLAGYQRVVVNPFLAVLGWLAWLFAIRQSMRAGNAMLFFFLLPWVPAPSRLFQFHCLDCGRTGWLSRLGRHACTGVLERRELESVGPPPVDPALQTRLWYFFVLVAIFLYCLVFR